jgi:glycosyltransferase involved in cell wall biosynthesis
MERAVVPSKVYTALAYGRPLLAVASEESDVVGIVRNWGCGLVASPTSPEDVAEKVLWARDHPAALTEMAASSAEAGRHFERGRQLGRLADLVGAVAGRR